MKKEKTMADTLTVTYDFKDDVHTIDTGGIALPKIIVDNRKIPNDQRGGTAKQMLAGAALYCYGSMLAAALQARDVDFKELHATAELKMGRSETGKSRVLKMIIRSSVQVNERDEAIFQRVQKMMAQGCLVTGSLHDGISMVYELEPIFFSE